MATPPSSRRSLPRRGPWLALLSVLVIGAMPFLVCPRLERARAQSRGEEALSDLAACLGDPRDDATLRGRRITAQLHDTDWPSRCRDAATRLEVALAALERHTPKRCEGRCCQSDADCRATVQARASLVQLRAALDGHRFEKGSAEALFGASGALLTTSPAGTDDDVPAVTTPPRPDPAGALARGGYDVAAMVATADGTWRLLLHARDTHAVVCDVDPTTATARCVPLPASIPIADSVLLVDGVPNAPLSILAREDDIVAPERWAIYDATTGARKLTLEHDALGATSSDDGEAAALIHDGTGYFVVAAEGDPIPVRAGVTDAPLLGPPLLLGPWLVTAHRNDDRTQLRAQSLSWHDRRPELAEATVVAEVEAWPPTVVTMQGCRSGPITALTVAADPPRPEAEVLVAVHDGGGWYDTIAKVDDPWFGLACDATGATLTEVTEHDVTDLPAGRRGRYVITRQRCDATGCSRERGSVDATRWRPASRYLATSIGDALAFIWRSGLGDVRAVVAPPDMLVEARSISAFEGDAHGGYGFDRHGAELLARDGRALLLVAHEVAGALETHGFVLNPDGTTRPLVVSQ